MMMGDVIPMTNNMSTTSAAGGRSQNGRIMSQQKFRLITRSDFDGLVCAMLFREMDIIDEILFVHPKDMQDGKVPVSRHDITCNLPYQAGVHLCFDHHLSEMYRNEDKNNLILDVNAKSAARVVYDYYGGQMRFPNISQDLMIAVDKCDAAGFSEEEILDPQGWILLSFLMDARTGLGRFRNFRISNYDLMMALVDYMRFHKDVNEILALPDIAERVELYYEHTEPYIEQLHRCSQQYGDLVLLDLREENVLYAGNRFMIYVLHPAANISMHVMWGRQKQNTVFAVGKSIVNCTSRANVGKLMLQYGGGGHEAAGTCQVENDTAAAVMEDLINALA